MPKASLPQSSRFNRMFQCIFIKANLTFWIHHIVHRNILLHRYVQCTNRRPESGTFHLAIRQIPIERTFHSVQCTKLTKFEISLRCKSMDGIYRTDYVVLSSIYFVNICRYISNFGIG